VTQHRTKDQLCHQFETVAAISLPSLARTPSGYSCYMPTPRVRDTWLVRRHEAFVLGMVYAAFTTTWFAAGWLLTHPLKDSSIVHTDQSISRWLVDHRTTGLNSLSFIGSMLADTVVKTVVTAIIAVVMLLLWRRWLEPLMVVVPLILEALCFITVTTLVARPRPDVIRLDTSPVGSGYPSGHMGAAVSYVAIVVVVFWHTRHRWIRALAVAFGVLIPAWVGLSRMYRGMHYFTDVVFGALLGGASVVAAAIVLRRAAEHETADFADHRRSRVDLAPVGAIER
jgi:membrane-associated phospholipid phosphatase